jgi:hypothetical protein
MTTGADDPAVHKPSTAFDHHDNAPAQLAGRVQVQRLLLGRTRRKKAFQLQLAVVR